METIEQVALRLHLGDTLRYARLGRTEDARTCLVFARYYAQKIHAPSSRFVATLLLFAVTDALHLVFMHREAELAARFG